MLNESTLIDLMTDLESDRVERKRSLSDRDKIRQTICAFANDLADHRQPGVIFVGLRDNGICAQLSITDELLRTLSQMKDDGQILPFPTMAVQKRQLGGCEMAVVEVLPHYHPPVRYNGRVWIRVGPRRGQATPDDERRLLEKRRAGNLPFDQYPIMGATLDELDLDFFQRTYLPSAVAVDVLAENRRSFDQQLASLRFLDRDSTPNVAAVLTFGKDPLRWIPGAYIQFLRIDGDEITDPIRHQKEITGPLQNQLLQLDEVLEANISISSDIRSGATEIRQPDYPIVALQQLCRNGILHRTYELSNAPVRIYWFSDRIEIHSPGGLYGNVNPDNFGHPGVTDYRNPMIAETMKVLGFVQRFGMGIPLARKELEKNGNPPPEFQFEGSSVLVTLRTRP